MRLNQHATTLYRWGLGTTLVAITYLATAPQDLPTVQTAWDKLNHFAAFLALSWLADFSYPDRGFRMEKIGGLLAYGVLLELIQFFLPDRMFSIADIGADLLGMAAYACLIPALKKTPFLKVRWQGNSPAEQPLFGAKAE